MNDGIIKLTIALFKAIFEVFFKLDYNRNLKKKNHFDETPDFIPNPYDDNNSQEDGGDVLDDRDVTIEEVIKIEHVQRFTWILDSGHGPKTKGKRSPYFEDGKQLIEYEFNRDIVEMICVELEKKGVDFFKLIESNEDCGSDLKMRVTRANEFAITSNHQCIYVSVHGNAGPRNDGQWTSARGLETWYLSSSKIGKKIAPVFQNSLVDKLGWLNRKIRTGQNFYVLKYTSMPAVLTENGFFNNRIEGRMMLSSYYRRKIADAHVEVIMRIENNGIDGIKN